MSSFYHIINVIMYVIIVYAFVSNFNYFVLMSLGFFVLRTQRTTEGSVERDPLFKSRLMPPISILAPAHNEELSIAQSTRSMLQLEYPEHEVIVVNDGSSDRTLQILIDEFHLYKSARQPISTLVTAGVNAVYESQNLKLLVIDKANGGKSDSLNAGLNYAATPLVAAVDADSLLESNSLLLVVKPFLEDESTIGVGGIIRVVNGCKVENGAVTKVGAPPSLLTKFQVVEYLRAFLGGRVALTYMNSLLLISGAFGLFRRDRVIEAGGFELGSLAEDLELVIRLHRISREKKRDYKIVFVPTPVCWTEVPDSWKNLGIQRRRWQRGGLESMWRHRGMLFNPKFGVVGCFGMPYLLLLEILGPCVEVTGYVITVIGLVIGFISLTTALLFFIGSVLFGTMISISAVLLEEFTTRRYAHPLDLASLIVAAFVENFGFRQVNALWRFAGILEVLRKKKKKTWGKLKRQGFEPQTT
ncbi:MAG: glycosyltransferase family 2 protein [Bryobacterales bacterium]|nr:glycosyltransferase family 2 protein [Bryobacterales bacterium]